MTYPTIYVSKEQLRRAGIDLGKYPNAGPNPCVSGMKRLYWGRDAKCIRSGRYVYHVPDHIYFQFTCG